MAGAFAAKAALLAVGIAVLRTHPPLLVVDLLYSELCWQGLSCRLLLTGSGTAAQVACDLPCHWTRRLQTIRP